MSRVNVTWTCSVITDGNELRKFLYARILELINVSNM